MCVKFGRFYPTYEELKLYKFGIIQRAHLRFYPTYEELKLVHAVPVGYFIQGFYPTYEELKLGGRDGQKELQAGILSYL
ncbi:hypothetical protein H0A61_00635 [Koleobacter methoxysyntrophicus]|uniref:Uncharacterized protein n=1 Tax=Koleobacter methoxysyntrophicus TaxID=2751313 RepID=A0A8A0RJC9_9FIRM|nr:hypothetical protein H0A61_00635 [Koleobacter methoxysyntrophicus]